MAIQINLIPDLKAEYLKAQRTKNTVMSLSLLISGGFVALVVLMFIHVNVNQRNHSNNLKSDIDALASEYSGIADLGKVITVQKQLESLPTLHSSKALISRLPTYLTRLTPEEVELGEFQLRFEDNMIVLSGKADSVAAVNVFIDILKGARYTIGNDKETVFEPFSNVILSTISSSEGKAVFEVSLTFDPQIFTNHDRINLTIPAGDVTLSERERPKLNDDERENDLFDEEREQ